MVTRRKDGVRFRSRALGTCGPFMQIGWVFGNFFLCEEYFLGNKSLCRLAIFLGFDFSFVAAPISTKRRSKSKASLGCCARDGGAAILWGFLFFSRFRLFGNRPVLLLSYIFLADIACCDRFC